jgi:hypothetical protein
MQEWRAVKIDKSAGPDVQAKTLQLTKAGLQTQVAIGEPKVHVQPFEVVSTYSTTQ